MMLLRLVTGAPPYKWQETELWFDTCEDVADVAERIYRMMGIPLDGRVSYGGTQYGKDYVMLQVSKNDDLRIWDQLLFTVTGTSCPG